jgi:acetyl esterase/lipase
MVAVTRRVTDVPYGDGAAHTLDIHLPPEGCEVGRLLVNLHGGGWYTGDKSLATRCCDELARRGLVVVNANYRILEYDPVPAMVADAIGVLNWVTSDLAPPVVSEAAMVRVSLAGDSAGAHVAALTSGAQLDARLVALLGLDSELVRAAPVIDSLVSWSGALCLAELIVGSGHPQASRMSTYVAAITGGLAGAAAAERIAQLDPANWMSADMPPTVIFTSALDFFQSSNTVFEDRARVRALPVTMVDFDSSHAECSHSWQLNPALAESQTTYDVTAAFVTDAFGRRKPAVAASDE